MKLLVHKEEAKRKYRPLR